MTSKNSFLVSMKENNKRRIWVWLLSAVLWLFRFPIGITMLIYGTKADIENGIFTGIEAQSAISDVVQYWMGKSVIEWVIIGSLAIICAIQGFSYLYSRKKVDLYHSVPVSKGRRFTVIYSNGVLICFIPYLFNLLLAIVIAAANGGLNANIMADIFFGVLVSVLAFFGVYAVTILAVMMTGNVIVTVMGTMVLLFYEIAVKITFTAYQDTFYDYFYEAGKSFASFTTPIGNLIEMLYKPNKIQPDSLAQMISAHVGSLLRMTALALIFGALAYFSYKRRPSEAAGKSMAFPKTKPVIKVLLVVLASLFTALFAVQYVGVSASTAMGLFWVIFVAALASCIMEVIYEMDIKAAFRKKYQILISAALAVLIFCIFRFDLTGFDKWNPNPDKLESAVIMANDMAYTSRYDKDFKRFFIVENQDAWKKTTDIEKIMALSEAKKQSSSEDEESTQQIWFVVAYQMKNGRDVWRSFSIDGTNEEVLNSIIGSSEYKEMSNTLYIEEFYHNFKTLNSTEITFDGGGYVENLSMKDMDLIRELYLKDFEKADFSTMKEEYSCGILNFDARTPNTGDIHITCEIYPSYKNVIGYLKEKGIYKENILNVDNVESVTVTNYHNEIWEQRSSREQTRYSNPEITKTFTDKKQIEELLPALYSNSFYNPYKASGTFSNNYSVTVQLKSGNTSSSYYRGDNTYSLFADKIPAFVENETAYE